MPVLRGFWGRFRGAFTFDGVDDAFDTGVRTRLPEWTVSVWLEPRAAPRSDQDAGPAMMEENFILSWDHRDPTYRHAVGVRVGGEWYAASFGAPRAGVWQQWVATYDGETLRAYVDGRLVSANEAPSGPADPTSGALRVAQHALQGWYFAGAVDELAVFDRALSATEVARLSTRSVPSLTATFTIPSVPNGTYTWACVARSDGGASTQSTETRTVVVARGASPCSGAACAPPRDSVEYVPGPRAVTGCAAGGSGASVVGLMAWVLVLRVLRRRSRTSA